MIFYISRDENGRRHITGTQADARAIDKKFEQIDIPTDKAGLMGYVQSLFDQIDHLNQLALEGVNTGVATGLELAGAEPVAQPVQAPKPESQLSRSIQMDEEFDKLPLARQLHFAATAMENARSAIPDAQRSLVSSPIMAEGDETTG